MYWESRYRYVLLITKYFEPHADGTHMVANDN